MKYVLFIPIVVSLLLIFCGNDQSAGVTDETVTRRGVLLDTNRVPAAGADIFIYKVSDTSRVPVVSCKTDPAGEYTLGDLKDGIYNIWAEKNSNVAFLDSMVIAGNVKDTIFDTLEKPFSIKGYIGLQPNHNPRTVFAQILGTDKYCGAAADGSFLFPEMARGTYTVRLVTTLPEYTPTFHTVSATSVNSHNDSLFLIPDTLWLVYTGIPIVTGISAAYDSSRGIVHLSWNMTDYASSFFQNYLIYRSADNGVKWELKGNATDTIFTDTLYRMQLINGTVQFIDTNNYQYKYQVVIQNRSNIAGLPFYSAVVTAVSPINLITKVSTTARQVSGDIPDSASVNTPVELSVSVMNKTLSIDTVIWIDPVKDSVIRKSVYSNQKSVVDTVYYSWSVPGVRNIICKIFTHNKNIATDTISVNVVSELLKTIRTTAVVSSAPDNVNLLYIDRNGHVQNSSLSAQSGIWSQWVNVRDITIQPEAPLSAVNRRPNTIDIFTIFPDNQVYTAAWQDNTGWIGWWNIPGMTVSANTPITSVSSSMENLDIFLTADDGFAYTAGWDPARGWRGWWKIGSKRIIRGIPVSAVSRSVQMLELFAIEENGNLLYNNFTALSQEWSEWTDYGNPGLPLVDVFAIKSTNSRMHSIAIQSDGHIFCRQIDIDTVLNWTDWSPVGTITVGTGRTVTGASRNGKGICLFTCDKDNKLYTTEWDSTANSKNTFQNWQLMADNITPGTPVSCAARTDGTIDLFVIKNGLKYYSKSSSASVWSKFEKVDQSK